MTPKDLVVRATDVIFSGDVGAVDRYISPAYIQHSTLAPDGIDGARALTANLPPGFRYERARIFAEGDLVVTHGTYVGLGPTPLVGIDLWRVEGDTIAEHWDALMPRFDTTASGRSQTDGPTEVREPRATEASRILVETFLDEVVIPGRLEHLPRYVDGEAYAQHNPLIRDGVAAMTADVQRLAQEGASLVITKRHRTVAEGEFVLTQSEGTAGGRPAAFYDIWRVRSGRLAEHWDVWFDQPAELPHANGLF